jgi:5-(aminomethyl)-3-furanmethanol phosphate kinase
MWVVKLGGSLNADDLLPAWLDLLVQVGGGRVTIVCGGGAFADEVRRAQAHWRFPDLPAHNMALLAMAQSAYLAQGLNPKLKIATRLADIRQVLHGGHTALWLPLDILRNDPGPDANWDVTSDSLALELAQQLNAERLVLVKACAIDPRANLSELSEVGVVDRRFARWAGAAALPIELMQHTELPRMRALLLGDTRSLVT